MFLTKKLPTQIFVIVIITIGAISLVSWQGILVFEDIRQISNDITKLSQDIHKAEKAMTGWKTYRNYEYGFEAKYPEIRGSVEAMDREYFEVCITGSELPGGPCFIVSVRDIILDNFIKEWNSLDPPFTKIYQQEDYILSGENATKLKSITTLGIDRTFIFIEKNNKGYILDYVDFDPVHNQILSTFKFIESIDTSNWKTYRNEEYGFEMKIPPDLVLQKNTGEAYTSFWGKLSGEDYFLQFGYISQNTLNTMGINYCEAYPNDSRCENFTFNSLKFLIDWDIETEGAFTKSRAEILKSEGGMIVISILHSPSQDVKSFFRQILSTFKFIE